MLKKEGSVVWILFWLDDRAGEDETERGLSRIGFGDCACGVRREQARVIVNVARVGQMV